MVRSYVSCGSLGDGSLSKRTCHMPPRVCAYGAPSASRAPRTSCFLFSTICGIKSPTGFSPCSHRLLHAASALGGWAMTFEEILDQAIAMLQRRGRVSYRALQRQFQLDDAFLQDLIAEIVEVLQLAVDQDHTMLVWTGGSSVPAPVSPPPSRTPLPDSQEPHLPPGGSAPDVQHVPEAERRQLTVMFCDLV